MKADLTRNTFLYWKHFTRVLMQQGRVQLDADWNEQAAILLHFFRSGAADIIGPFGRPAANPGYDLRSLNVPSPNPGDFALSAGHFFVGGILCENTPDPIVAYPPTFTPDGLTVTTFLDTLAAQNRFLVPGEYIEIYDASNPTAFTYGTVSDSNPATHSLSFKIVQPSTTVIKNSANLRVRRALTYLNQPDFPLSQSDITDKNATYLIYLDVWERLITYREDGGIREVALRGPDTAARAKLVRQVKSIHLPAGDQRTPLYYASWLQSQLQPPNRGYLSARVQPTQASTDPCIISPTSGYRGPENQLYRVEIHTGSKDSSGKPTTPTFKWSRENGSVVFSILSGWGTKQVTLDSLGRDDRFGLAVGDWVEMLDDTYVLLNSAGTLLQVQSIDHSTMQVTFTATPDTSLTMYPPRHPILRRWDQKQGDESQGGLTLGKDNAALIQPPNFQAGDWFDLEDGVQIQFQQFPNGQKAPLYRTGDYWLIPARTETGDVEWPTQVLKDAQGNSKKWVIPLPPDGVNHYYAPIGTILLDPTGAISLDPASKILQPIPVPSFQPLEPNS